MDFPPLCALVWLLPTTIYLTVRWKSRAKRPVSWLIPAGLVVTILLNALVVWATRQEMLDDGLMDASAMGDLAAIQRSLNAGASPNASAEDGTTAEKMAAENGHKAAARLIADWRRRK